MLENFPLRIRLGIGFSLILLILVSVAGFLVNRMELLGSFTERLYKEPMTVSNTVLHVDGDLVRIQRIMKDVLLSKDYTEINTYRSLINKHLQDVADDFDKLDSLSAGDEKHYEDAKALIAQWRPIRDEIMSLVLAHKYDEAIAVERGRDAEHVAKIREVMAEHKIHAEEIAKGFIEKTEKEHEEILSVIMYVVLFATLLCGALALLISRSITMPVLALRNATERIAGGELDSEISIESRDEIGSLARDFRRMASALKDTTKKREEEDWIKSALVEINNAVQGEGNMSRLCQKIIATLARSIDAKVGTIYAVGEDGLFHLEASYAFDNEGELPDVIMEGEGLVGQAAVDKKITLLTEVPEGYLYISSSLGEMVPRNLAIVPCLHDGLVQAVFELGTIGEINEIQRELFERVRSNIAIAIHTVASNIRVQQLLEQTQAQAEELLAQQEELQSQNEELQTQSEELRASEEELKTQQEELQVTNEELEEKNRFLEYHRKEIAEKNQRLEIFSAEVEEKARALELSGKYKSEFLANMSHELRTPLNSLLLLSRDLQTNRHGHLSEDEVESAGIIYKSGNDLLQLINEILDLSRIEAGKMSLHIIEVEVEDVKASLSSYFRHVAEERGVDLNFSIDSGAPRKITTDPQRLEQVLKNLLSNALKFTEKGGVSVSIHPVQRGVDLKMSGLVAKDSFAISVTDTGIGISEDKLATVFEAFHQIDGGTSRKYEGTGLGLSISRQMAKLLGGEIQVASVLGQGSTFTLYLPVVLSETKGEELRQMPLHHHETEPVTQETEVNPFQSGEALPPVPFINDDRDLLSEKDKAILIIEDDENFARILMKQCHENRFKCIVSGNGSEGLRLAKQYGPEAIILDNRLPGMNGIEVLERLKEDVDTRHIPVHMMSVDDAANDAFRHGAIGYLVKPVTQEAMDEAFLHLNEMIAKEMKDLLVVEDNKAQRIAIKKLIGNGDVKITEASTAQETLELLKEKRFDCMVLDLGLPDMSGFELLAEMDRLKDIAKPPVIVYTGRELTKEEDLLLHKYTDMIIVKGVKSDERLLDETALFLHRVVRNLPQNKQNMIANLYDRDVMFQNKKVLIVDDDMRNSFALAKILRDKGMEVFKAEGGQKALDLLAEEKGIDLVLMDIMMPDMDGYETTRRIRKQKEFAKLPIIALTAKAMKDDREKCIDAGSSDYLAKPVDIDRLFSMMRVWLYQ